MEETGMKEALRHVEKSPTYKEFIRAHGDATFVHAFRMYGQGDEGWQFGYYSPSEEKIHVFTAEPVTLLPADDVFSKTQPHPLAIDTVTTAPEEAIAAAKQLMQHEYSAETAKQIIMILQHLDQPLYNLTIVSHTMNFINIRVDASTGEILTHELRHIMSLKR